MCFSCHANLKQLVVLSLVQGKQLILVCSGHFLFKTESPVSQESLLVPGKPGELVTLLQRDAGKEAETASRIGGKGML